MAARRKDMLAKLRDKRGLRDSQDGLVEEDNEEETASPTGGETTVTEEEVKEAENLASRLAKRRRRKQQELEATLTVSESDVDHTSTLRDEKARLKESTLRLAGGVSEEEPITAAGDLDDELTTSRSLGSARRASRSRADIESIRQRLQSKVESAKHTAEVKVAEEVRPSRRLRDLKARPVTTRFDDPDTLREEQLLEQSISAKARALGLKGGDRAFLPSEEECYDFFTKTWEPEPVERPEPTDDQQEATEILIESTILTTEPSHYIPRQQRTALEQQLLWVPTMTKPADKRKIPTEELRFLEEEGLYSGVRPTVALRNLNLAEQRMLRRADGGARWFGQDGRLIALPDPLSSELTKPVLLEPDELDPSIQTDYQKAVLKDFDSRYIDGIGSSRGNYQLDVDIGSLTFSHHPLYSREHILAARLKTLHTSFTFARSKNLKDFYSDKLRALRVAKQRLSDEIEKRRLRSENNPNATLPTDPEAFDAFDKQASSRIQGYNTQIRQTRQQRDTEESQERSLLKRMVRTWKQLKELRDNQGYTNTKIKLQMRKDQSNKEADLVVWNDQVEAELEDERLVFEENYEKQNETYIRELDEWKVERKMERKRRKKRGIDDDESDLPPKPLPPERFDYDVIKQRITDKYLENKRRPGEPVLHPELVNTATVTPVYQCPRAEQERRQTLSNWKSYIKVLFNNKEVGRSAVRVIEPNDFVVPFRQIFNIQIVQWPESIKLQLYESGLLSSTLLAEIYCVIPDPSVTADNIQSEDMEFSSDVKIYYSHEGVGSGLPVFIGNPTTNGEEVMPHTTGQLTCSIAWGLAEDGTPLVADPGVSDSLTLYNRNQVDPLAALGAAGTTDIRKLLQWVQDAKLDPNDPSNVSFYWLIQMALSGDLSYLEASTYFRLDHLQHEFDFVTDDELMASKRFRLITMRDEEIPEFRNYKMIPIKEIEIIDSIFTNYEKKLEEDKMALFKEGMDDHQRNVTAFRLHVREQVMKRFQIASHYYTLQDLVIEETLPDISTVGEILSKLLEPRRPLRPVRRERKTVTAQNLGGADVEILVNIVRAFNIPVRRDPVKGETGGPVLVRPLVEICFQKQFKKTSLGDGPNPSWNEQLRLRFKAPNNDFSPASLNQIDDIIFVNLYDEFVVNLNEDDRTKSSTIHHRLEKRWLGSIQIPFSTIYMNGRIEGTFQVLTPHVLLGYTYPSAYIDTTDEFATETIGSTNTYMSLFMTIEPALSPGEPVREKFDSNEDPKLLMHAEDWQTKLEKRFPKRHFRTTVVDINGQSVFITRYFKDLVPPSDLSVGVGSMTPSERVARFVSLVPFVSDSTVFAGICDIWSTCDQFMQMLAGDEEEHAVLLCNLFAGMGKKSYLILGAAIPEGSTAYVLTVETDPVGERWIWNPSTGRHYRTSDPYCPLKSIGCLVNAENIWANVSTHSKPDMLDYDLSKKGHWQPIFGKSFPHRQLATVQPDQLEWKEPNIVEVMELAEKLEKKLKEKIQSWRQRFITRWNRFCTNALRQLLTKLETRSNTAAEDHRHELENVLNSYNMSGFPLQMPYTDLETAVEAVEATGIHLNASSEVEFSLAVHIHPYPNGVMALWIYVAALMRKQQKGRLS